MQISNRIMERKLMWAGGKDQYVKICANAKWKSINKKTVRWNPLAMRKQFYFAISPLKKMIK
jgi:hypothetical protein